MGCWEPLIYLIGYSDKGKLLKINFTLGIDNNYIDMSSCVAEIILYTILYVLKA